MVYTTPHPDDDAQLAAWRRRQAEDAVRGINIRLPLGLARLLRADLAWLERDGSADDSGGA